MRNMMIAASLLVVAATGSPADAAKLPGEFNVTGTVGLVSDYRFRGISLSNEDPALQGGITVAHESGFYAGTWGSSIDSGGLYGSTEVDLFGGWSGEVVPGVTFDGMVAYYAYPNGNDALGNADYFESTAKLTRSFGAVKATAGASYSWEQSALGGSDNKYAFADASVPLGTTPITLKGHVGYTDGALAPTGHYVDWSLGADATIGPVTLGLAYVDTDIAPTHGVDSTILFSLTAAF